MCRSTVIWLVVSQTVSTRDANWESAWQSGSETNQLPSSHNSHVNNASMHQHQHQHQRPLPPQAQQWQTATAMAVAMTTAAATTTTTGAWDALVSQAPGMFLFLHYHANLHTGACKPQHQWLAASAHVETQEGCLLSLSGKLSSFFTLLMSISKQPMHMQELWWHEGLTRYCNDRNNCHVIKTVKVATQRTNEVTDGARRCHLLVPLVGFFLFQFKEY